MTKIYDKIYENIISKINVSLNSIFLIGKDLSSENSIRKELYNRLKDESKFSIYFPERLMKEVYYSSQIDFLTLENLLGENVNCVVMCIESAGSIAELGAFSNHKGLRDKLMVILDKQFEKDRSFINLGPLKVLNKKQIFWEGNFDESYINHDSYKKIKKKINIICNESNVKKELTNPIINEIFILVYLYCFEFLSNKRIINIIKYLNKNKNKKEIEKFIIMTKATLSSLSWQRSIKLNNGEYYLTNKGQNRLIKLIKYSFSDSIKILDNIRVEILNRELRNI